MKYSKTTLMELSHKYSNILKKCAFLNAMILMGTMISVPAMADGYTPVTERLVVAAGEEETLDSRSFTELGGDTIDSGAAIRNLGTVTVTDSYFDGNYITKPKSNNAGGAIYNGSGATLTVSGTEFVGNNIQNTTTNTSLGGAIYNLGGTMAITDSRFIGNHVDGLKPRGGAIHNTGNMTLSGNVFQKNETINTNGTLDMMASAVYQSSGTSTVTNNLFGGDTFEDGNVGNSVFVNNSGTVYFEGNTFKNNTVAKEAVVHSQGATTKTYFDGTNTFEGNKGGAIYNWVSATTTFNSDSTTNFVNNNAAWNPEQSGSTLNGGAIYNNSTMTFEEGSTANFTGNNAKEGGAIYNTGSLALNGTSVFSGNMAGDVRNDIYNTGTLTIGGDLTLDGGIAGTGTVEFTEGSSLKGTLLSSTTPLITAGTLNVDGVVTADLTFDIADTEATWTYASAGEWNGNDFTLSDATQNLNPLFDVKQGADNGTIVVTRKAAEEIVENMTEAGATGNEAATVAAIAQVGTETIADSSGKSVAAAIKDAAQTGDMATVKELTDRVNPAEAPVKHIVSATTAIMGAVANRMSVASATPAPVVGRSGGDWNDDPTPGPITNLSPWVQGLYNKTHNSQGIGFNAYSRGFAFGADTRLNDAWTVGIGYAYTATDVKNRQRTTNIYGHNYFIYGQYKPNNWYVNAIASLGQADYHDKSVLKSEYDVDSYSGQVMVGYQKGLFDNYAGFRFTQIKTDEYDNGLTVVKAKDTNVGTAIIGTKISKSFTCKKNVTWTPEFRLAGTYDVTSRASSATMNVIGSTASYTVTGDRLSRAALQTGIGLKARVKDFELVGGYDVELRSQNNTQAVNLKAIYHF